MENRASSEILLVEAEALLAHDLEQRLIALGYRVCGILNSIEEALGKIELTQPDLVLMDIDVSGEMDCGIAAADTITKRWQIPVVFIAALTGAEKIKRSGIACPFGFILKPFQDRDLSISLEMAIFLGKLDRERRQAEVALRESEEKYSSLIANMMDGVLQTSPDGRVFSANQSACEMLGMTEEEIIAAGRAAVVDAGDPRLSAAMEERARTGRFKGELNLKRKDGSVFPVELSSSIYTDKSGNRRTSMVFRDVTARKMVEDALRETERQYRELVQKAPAAILEFDYRSQSFTAVNEAMGHMTGYSQEELLALGPLDLIDEQDRATFLNNMGNRLLGKELERNVEYKIRTKDGRIRDAILDIEVFVDDDGMPRSSMVVGYDVTDRKQAEEALQKSEHKYRSLINTMQEGLVGVDADWFMTFVNDSFLSMVGYSRDSLLGKPFQDLVREDYRDKAKSELTLRNHGEAHSYELVLIRSDGNSIFVLCSPNSSYDSTGAYLGGFGVIADITERKQAEQEREKLIIKLEKALAEVKTLRGFIPICANCKKIRDDEGFWHRIESYIQERSDAQFSHGICPECMKKLYPEYANNT